MANFETIKRCSMNFAGRLLPRRSMAIGSTTKDKAKGMALSYMDARAVMDRLDGVCGPADGNATMRSPGRSRFAISASECLQGNGSGRLMAPEQLTSKAKKEC